MPRSTKAPIPPTTLVFFWITFFLTVAGVCYLLGLDRTWITHLRMPHFGAEQPADARLKAQVWVNKSTGIYYCPGSALYGRQDSGVIYMAQGDALQSGYRPSLGEPCQ